MQIRGGWAWAILVVMFLSLGLNFFFAGFLAERWRGGRGFGGPSMMQVLGDFPPEMRRSIGRELWADRGRYRAAFDEVREKRRELSAAMREPALDLARIRALMADVRRLTMQVQEQAQETTIEVLQRTPVEERARIGERMRGGGPPWMR